MFVRGAAGIGKTRLLAEFAAAVRRDDPHVIMTAALDYACSPFAPIVAVAEAWSRTRPALFKARPDLRKVVELIVGVDARDRAPTAADRRTFFDAVAHLFRQVAGEAPVTVIVDDLQNADVGTYHLLYHIVAGARGKPLLIVAAERREPAASYDAREAVSARFERLDDAAVIEVRPLSADACDALVRDVAGGRLGTRARAAIARRAEGNPLFAEQLVRQALDPARDGHAAAHVPATVAFTVRERLSAFSADAHDLLCVAAVIGRTFEPALLSECTGAPEEAVHRALREAVRAGLVDETDDDGVFRFHHALIHETVYGEMLAAERRRHHARVLAVLERSTVRAPAALLGYHAHRCGDREATVRYNEAAAGEALASLALELAIEHYERALSVLREDDADAIRLARTLARVCLAAGYPDQAIEWARRSLTAAGSHDDAGVIAETLLILADAYGQAGADEARLDTIAEMCRVLEGVAEPRLRARRCIGLAETAIAERRFEAAVGACDEGIAASAADVPASIALHNARAYALLMQRRYDDAIAAQDDAVRLAHDAGSSEAASAAQFELGMVLSLSGRLSCAQTAFATAAAGAAARHATTERALSLAFQSEMALMRGRYAESNALIRDVLADARRFDHPTIVVITGRVGLFLGLATGDEQLIADVVDVLALEALLRDGTPERYFPLSGAFSQYLASRGRIDEAREVLRRAVRRLSAKRLRSTDWSPCSMLTVAMLGDESDIPAARAPIAGWFTPYARAFREFFDAIVAARFNDADALQRSAAVAADELRAFDFRQLEGHALALAGKKREALELFEAGGALADARRLRDELTPRNRLGRSANALTTREREVAELVAHGLTNRAIADRLAVSEKTVETHLASIFAKTGARTRRDVSLRTAVS